MTPDDYLILSKDLQHLSKEIPLCWGKIQNNQTDNQINMFDCPSLASLENSIETLSLEDQAYFKRRWFLWQCAQVDEYLFYKASNVEKNPNPKDQAWDIRFNQSMAFDVKGTVVPKVLRHNFEFNQEEELIHFYYQNQSKGVRQHIQNRLFIVHHSFRDAKRSMFLRCHWELKKLAYQSFNHRMTQKEINLIPYKSVFAKCIFIIEGKENDFYFKIN